MYVIKHNSDELQAKGIYGKLNMACAAKQRSAPCSFDYSLLPLAVMVCIGRTIVQFLMTSDWLNSLEQTIIIRHFSFCSLLTHIFNKNI
jgi:hypothetical protein